MDKKFQHQMIFLDLLRFFSCLVVVDGHFTQIFICRLFGLSATVYNYQKPFIAFYYDLSRLAVMVFFVLSGFLITFSTIKDIKKERSFNLMQYLKKRFLRIFPPLWFSILLTICIFLIIHKLHLFGSSSYLLPGDLYSVRSKADLSIKEILQNSLLVPGTTGGMNGPLWSLSYEFLYYLLFAIITLALCKSIKKAFSFFIVVSLPIVCFLVISKQYYLALLEVIYLFPTWLLGALLGWMYAYNKLKFSTYVVWLIPIGLIICIKNLSFIVQHSLLASYIYALFTLAIMYLALTCSYNIPRLLIKVARGSQYTYTLYLIHFPIGLLLLSLIGYHLISFHWYHLVLLNIVFLFVTNLCSYHFSLILENRNNLINIYINSKTLLRRFVLINMESK